MAKVELESGVQLFARISSEFKPIINNIDEKIFPDNGPKPTDIIEISGESNVGKSIMLMELIAKVILPVKYNGKNAGVVFINCDNNFQLFKLLAILEKCICKKQTENDTVHVIIKSALQNLTILKCSNVDQFDLAIISAEQQFSLNSQNILLAIDSISSFYWLDYYKQIDKNSTFGMNTYLKNLLIRLGKIIDESHSILCYTKPLYFGKNINYTFMRKIEYRIELCNKDENDEEYTNFQATIVYGKNTENDEGKIKVRNYTIDCFGINWNKE